MPIAVGTRLGPYEVLAAFGSGERHYAVTLAPRGQALEIGTPRPILGDTPALGILSDAAMDYSPTMKRFLIAAPVRGERSAPVFLETNGPPGLPTGDRIPRRSPGGSAPLQLDV